MLRLCPLDSSAALGALRCKCCTEIRTSRNLEGSVAQCRSPDSREDQRVPGAEWSELARQPLVWSLACSKMAHAKFYANACGDTTSFATCDSVRLLEKNDPPRLGCGTLWIRPLTGVDFARK